MKKALLVSFIVFAMLSLPHSVFSGPLNLTADAKMISPDGDNKSDKVNIAYELPSDGEVSVRVYQVVGEGEIIVRNILRALQESQSAGRYEVEWNGSNDSGQTVSNGTYRVVVAFVPQSGRRLEERIELNVEVTPVFTDLKFLPDPYTPGQTTARIEFQQTKEAHVVLRILNEYDQDVYTRNLGQQPADQYFIDWNGISQMTGINVPIGEYLVVVAARAEDGKLQQLTTKFQVQPGIEVSRISASPRIFDPNDEGGNRATTIQFNTDKARVDYQVTIQDASGMDVWQYNFAWEDQDDRMKATKTFTWGGARLFQMGVKYQLERIERVGDKETGFIDTPLAMTYPEKSGPDTVGSGDDLVLRIAIPLDEAKYTKDGLDTKAIIQQLSESRKLYRVGDKMPFDGYSWDVVRVVLKRLDRTTFSLPNGDYTVRIRVKDPETNQVSAELGTAVKILSKVAFNLCVSQKGSRDNADADDVVVNNLLKQYQTNWCDRKQRLIRLVIRGGSLKTDLQHDVDVFDPHTLQWRSVKKVDNYISYKDDKLRIGFRVTKDANISAQLRSSKGGVIRKLGDFKGHLTTDIDRAFVEWDGLDDRGKVLDSGYYLLDIVATDIDPTAPKTLNTTVVILLKDQRKFFQLDPQNSNAYRHKQGWHYAEFNAFPPVVSFADQSRGSPSGDSNVDDVLASLQEKAEESAKRPVIEGDDGILSLVFDNNLGEEFELEYLFTRFSPNKKEEGSYTNLPISIGRDFVLSTKSYEVDRSKQQSRLSVGYYELSEPGYYDMWVFGRKVEERPCPRPKRYRFASADDEERDRDAEKSWNSFANCYEKTPDMVVMNLKLKGLGTLTETGEHLNKVVSEGFRALASGL